MEPHVDIDLICHFGRLKNIDLSQRGIYFIQVKMFYGFNSSQSVYPVGVFSAPSTLDCFVGTQRVPFNA